MTELGLEATVNTIKRTDKPWGYEHLWAQTDTYVGKLIHINAGKQLSLQYHEYKDESVYVLHGTLILVWEKNSELQETLLEAGQSAHVPTGLVHRFRAPEGIDVDVIEVSTNHLDDVIRVQDDFGRAGQ